MKISKRILSVLLALCMVLTLFSSLTFSVSAESTITSGTTGECTWTLDGTKLTVSGNGAMANYKYSDKLPWSDNITEVVIEKGVTSIGEYAFNCCALLESITIPNSVKSIGDAAFYFCQSLKSIKIPSGVTKIGTDTFYECESLKSISIPSSVTTIAGYAFYKCTSLKSISIPKGVTSIGMCAFEECSILESITIPNGVTSIGKYAFYKCTSLKSITIPDNITSLGNGAFGDTAYYSDTSNWENGVLYIGKHFIKADAANIPKSYSIKSGTLIIADGAFNKCSGLENITIPNSVTNIGYGAFWGCSSLKSITIPGSVTSIDEAVFYECSSLANITIPTSVKNIGCNAVCDTAYYNNAQNWENGALYIGKHLIEFDSESNLKSCSVKSGTLIVADRAFLYCDSLESITIPTSVTNIGNTAFWGCSNLKNIMIPVGVTSIGDNAFRYCSADLAICSATGSYAEKYAKANSIKFTACQHTDTCIVGKKAATCTKNGYTGDTKCNSCGAVTVKGKTIDKIAHKTKTTTIKATQKANGVSVTTCTVCVKVTKNVVINNVKSITLSTANYVYNGKVKTPGVIVKDSKGKTLKKGTDYTVTYSNNKYVGKASVKVTLKGNYSGSKTLTFKINPKSTNLKSVAGGKKQITAKWNKQATQTTGYQIQYSTSSAFKNAKTVTVTSNKTTSKIVKNLTGGKKYYVRVRTYKTVKNTKYYSAWSAKKSATAKKK